MKKLLVLPALLILATVSAQAAIIDFDLKGIAGFGLLPGNEPIASGGTGGEIGSGITFDDATNLLTLNIGWGSSQGFTDLSSTATASHIHVTASNNGAGFTQTGAVLFTLTRSTNAVTGGTFTGPSNAITLTAAQKTDLFNGKYYVNIHTANNGGGELRGFLVPVPEPGTLLWGAAVGLVAGFRRVRSRRA